MTTKIKVLGHCPFKGEPGEGASFGPDGEVNTVVPIKNLNEHGFVCGDLEIGSDGFTEIMFMIPGLGVIKIKRLPGEDEATLSIHGTSGRAK